MASFSQWRTSIDAGDLRRVTWVAGEQSVLVEEVVDTTKNILKPSDMDYVSLSYEPSYDRLVWAAANQYPLTPGAHRLVLIRDADRLTRWQQLTQWLSRTRTMPGVYLLFVSDKPEQLAARKGVPEHLSAIRAPRGFLVRCSGLNEADAIAWVRRRCPMDEQLARHLLTRTGGNLAAAAAVCAKLALFKQGAGSATINALVTESPVSDFADNVIALQKREALLSLPGLDHSEQIKTIALLDSRLDLLERLHRMQISGRSWREVSGINPFLVKQYQPHSRWYDRDACLKRRRVLAVLDDALRNGARVGVMEALVASW